MTIQKAYRLLHEWADGQRLPRGFAGRALLELCRTEPTGRLRRSGTAALEQGWERARAPRPAGPAAAARQRPRYRLPEDAAPGLTVREREVLELAAEGLTAEETARELGVAPMTVRAHRKNALRRLGARNVAHAVNLLRP